MFELTPATEQHVNQSIARQLGWPVSQWTPILGGRQNRLFRLDGPDAPAVVAKLYRRDRWQRARREFSVLHALNVRGAAHIPRAYLCDLDYEPQFAVYSFEPGQPLAAADITPHLAANVAQLLVELHQLQPDHVTGDIEPAVEASFSVDEQLAVIEGRLAHFESSAGKDAARELKLRQHIQSLIERTTADLSPAQRAARLSPERWRLNTADFGPQNLLFDTAGGVVAVDFEAAGWDDPARAVMGFLNHVASDGLPDASADAFLRTYAESMQLPPDELERFERVGRLQQVEWLAILASALSDANIFGKRFADPEFDLQVYVEGVLGLLRARLARLA